jgi:hypothetical protein
VAKAIKAAAAAGVNARIEVDNTGKIIILTGVGVAAGPEDDLDKELQDWEAGHGQG